MLKPMLKLSAETVSGGIVRGITYTQVCRAASKQWPVLKEHWRLLNRVLRSIISLKKQ